MNNLEINIPDDLVDQVDDCYENRGFNSRNDFIVKAIRDAVNAEDPFTEQARKDIQEARENDGESISLEEVKERLNFEE